MKIFRGSLAVVVALLVTITLLSSACATPQAPPTTPPTSRPNLSPVISSITANPAEAIYGESITLTCIATDPDYDPFDYIWSASEGNITGTGNKVAWMAPNKEGNFDISVTIKDSRGGQTTNKVMVPVSAPTKTIIINPVAEETGTVDTEQDEDYTRTRAGDDAQNIGYRAFWSFDISKLAGKNIQSANLKFTTGNIIGSPFWFKPSGLGGLRLWKDTYGDKLPEFGYVGSRLLTTGDMLEPPTVVDVSTEVRLLTGYDRSRFQVEALFDRISNGNNSPEGIEWSSVVLEVTYSVK